MRNRPVSSCETTLENNGISSPNSSGLSSEREWFIETLPPHGRAHLYWFLKMVPRDSESPSIYDQWTASLSSTNILCRILKWSWASSLAPSISALSTFPMATGSSLWISTAKPLNHSLPPMEYIFLLESSMALPMPLCTCRRRSTQSFRRNQSPAWRFTRVRYHHWRISGHLGKIIPRLQEVPPSARKGNPLARRSATI